MERLFEALRPLIRFAVERAAVVFGAALLLAAGGLYYATHLSVDTDFSNLIPPDSPSVQALEKLRDTVGAESEAAVAIVSPSFEANKAFAEDFIPRVLALQGEGRDEPYFSRVDYRQDTEFLKDNALYFATPAELDQLDDYLTGLIEDAKLEANPFFFDLDEEEEEEEADADATADELQAVYDDIVAKEYPVSDDSTTLVLRFYPTGSQTDVQFIDDAYGDLEALVDEMQPATYHPAMEVTMAGRLLRQLTEVRAITNDVLGSFGAGAASVLLVVVLYFFYKAYHARAGRRLDGRVLVSELARTPVMALVIGLPLLISLSWTFGTAYLAYGQLNLMTSTLGLVLFGLGIDYGIHFYARYAEERGRGHGVLEAATITFQSTGQAIAIGAMTTAAALYVLLLADFRGFSEFGFISGTGILFALVSMLLVMPALLSLFERFGLLDLERRGAAAAPVTDAAAPRRRFVGARGIVLASLAAVVAAVVFLPRVSFEYEFGKLEPTYEEYNARRDLVRRVYDDGNRRNPAYVVLDDAAEVDPVVAAIRRQETLEKAAAALYASVARDVAGEADSAAAAQQAYLAAKPDSFPAQPTPTIDRVESLQDRFPLDEAGQQRKLARIAEVRALLEDPFVQAEASEDLDRLRRAAQTTDPIALEEVPEFLRERFTSKSGDIGNFVIIYPSVGLSDGRLSIAFSDDVGTITTADGAVYHAGSTSLVAADMLRLMQSEAEWMVAATFFIVLLLMALNFRSVRWTLLAGLPLVVGVLWMLLLMEVFGLKLNFYNLIVLPAVLGIGNDAGVHLVHRYREEGRYSIRQVLRSTGEHVTMGSLTTMIGFAGLLLSFHPGLQSIGQLAVVGIGTTLLAALLFLPALLQWLEDREDARTRAHPPAEPARTEPAA